MAERRTYRVVSNRAPLDALISYHTDARPLVAAHSGWIGQHHLRGTAFVEAVLQALDAVLVSSATSAKETAEAVAATQYQTEVMQQAKGIAIAMRKRGAFIADEMELMDEYRLEAPRVRAACGVGSRANFDRQTGLRRLLLIQKEGLTGIAGTWNKWNPAPSGQPSDLERVNRALADLESAITGQAKEQVEAQMALDQLEARVGLAVESMNRIIRLVNSVSGEIPPELRAGLETLETHHSGVFWSQGSAEEPEAPMPATDPNRPMD